jgi:hypothetical protein
MSSGSRLLATAVLLLALGGCGDSGAGVAGKPTQPSATSGSAVPGAPVVTVVDAGDEPRAKIRLHVAKGDTTHATMTMRTSLSQTIDGRSSPPVKTPPISLGMLVEVSDVGDDGTIDARFSYDTVDVKGRGAQAQELEKALRSMIGVHGTLRSTDTGALTDGHFEVPSNAPAILKSTLSSFESQLQGMTVPFPTEPVGIGATWTVTTKVEVNRIRTENEVRYRLVERTGDRVVLEVEISQTAPEQDPKLPNLPAGAAVHLTSLSNSGSGHVVVTPSSLLPVSMTSDVSGTTDMTIEQGGQSGHLVQDTVLELGLSQD